ncbi:hypothetical protein [Nisaea sp.]|uniref:hypothetical protein n=1 Tax=Nisaea sp. TaxID=2024842 RepID=UPI003B524894
MASRLIGRSDPDPETLREIGPLWAELHGKLWHTTHPERFLGIIKSQAVLVEPDLPENERWGTSNGPKNYPFVRHIGGLSLFDFLNFDPAEYRDRYPVSSWRSFVPYRSDWNGAVWIEVNRTSLQRSHFLTGPELRDRYVEGGDLAHNIMPHIEAAYLAELPISACRRALFTCWGEEGYREFSLDPFDGSAYAMMLSGWRTAVFKHLEQQARRRGKSIAAATRRAKAENALSKIQRRTHDE